MEKERDGRRERERDEKWINNIENVQHELKSNGENLYMHFSFFRKLISTHKTKMFELSWISRFSLRPRPHRNRIVYDESYSYALCSSCHGEKKNNWSSGFRFVMGMTKRKPKFFFWRLNVSKIDSIYFARNLCILHKLYMQRQPCRRPFLEFHIANRRQRVCLYRIAFSAAL